MELRLRRIRRAKVIIRRIGKPVKQKGNEDPKNSNCNTVLKISEAKNAVGGKSNRSKKISLIRSTSIEQNELLLSAVELRISFLKTVIGNLIESGSSIEKIAGILCNAECRLGDVIYFQNVELTRSFLKEQDLTSQETYDEAYYRIDFGNLRASVDRLMSFLDLEHTGVLLKYGPHKDIKIKRFFRNLVSMTMQHRNLKALEIFVPQIAKWNILDKETCMLLEQEVFFKADKEVIQIFLQSGLHNHIYKVFGINILVALFGNPNIKIGFLKRKKLNVNARGSNDATALHYATKSKSFEKVKYLLDRGVEVNSKTLTSVTALNLALCESNVNPIENDKCAELLLQYGADPLLLSSNWKMFECCLRAESFTSSCGIDETRYKSIEHLSELTLAYLCMQGAVDIKKIDRICNRCTFCTKKIIKNQSDSSVPYYEKFLWKFLDKCHEQLEMLKKHEIRENLSMFTVLRETGLKLFQLLDKKDCNIIYSFIDKYSNDMTLNRYYLNALREHMRQVRKLAAHRNRAMFVIATSIPILAPYFIVLEKIVSYFTPEDFIIFQ